MLIPILLGATLLAPIVPAADTTWWRTDGAAVLQTDQTCSLFFYTNDTAAIFSWTTTSERISFQSQSFRFDPDDQVAVVVRFDDQILPGNLTGTGDGNMLTVPADHLEDRLPHAHRLDIQFANGIVDSEVSMSLNPSKMPALLTAVAKCRHMLR